MKIRFYVERMMELNKLLDHFPVKTGDPAAAPMQMDDNVNILKFGNPNTPQQCMIEPGFDTQASTPSDFVNLRQQTYMWKPPRKMDQ
jgi:hypothetical protein